MFKIRYGLLCAAVTLLLSPASVLAQTSLIDVVKQAINSNPEVQASWEALQEVTHEERAAFGGYLPRVDLLSRVGHESVESPHYNTESYAPAEVSIALRQLLFDGYATPSEVERLGYNKLSSYFELLQKSEETAFETVRAYVDVLRFRELLDYASENYHEHLLIFQQVKERADSGVGRGVDLEQATGRLALAESNRLTEANNLHDVTARYLRLTGQLPDQQLDGLPDIASLALPPDANAALRASLQTNPGFKSAIENVRAAQKARDVRKAAYLPTLELLARYDVGSDRDEVDGHTEKTVVELNLSYNLFRGGSDQATVRQFSSRLNRAINLREKACRDLRQTMSIVYTERNLLETQLVSLKQHEDSIANARIAYRKQFDIGQRTLLDLLDSENEFFRARRAHAIAVYDHFLASARALATMGQLLTTIGAHPDTLPAVSELKVAPDQIDPEQICPAEVIPESLYMWQPGAQSGNTAITRKQ